jgi:hypothetical protein
MKVMCVCVFGSSLTCPLPPSAGPSISFSLCLHSALVVFISKAGRLISCLLSPPFDSRLSKKKTRGRRRRVESSVEETRRVLGVHLWMVIMEWKKVMKMTPTSEKTRNQLPSGHYSRQALSQSIITFSSRSRSRSQCYHLSEILVLLSSYQLSEISAHPFTLSSSNVVLLFIIQIMLMSLITIT